MPSEPHDIRCGGVRIPYRWINSSDSSPITRCNYAEQLPRPRSIDLPGFNRIPLLGRLSSISAMSFRPLADYLCRRRNFIDGRKETFSPLQSREDRSRDRIRALSRLRESRQIVSKTLRTRFENRQRLPLFPGCQSVKWIGPSGRETFFAWKGFSKTFAFLKKRLFNGCSRHRRRLTRGGRKRRRRKKGEEKKPRRGPSRRERLSFVTYPGEELLLVNYSRHVTPEVL